MQDFWFFWLFRQYQTEKEELKEKLLADYKLVYEQQIDTLIMETIITPTLKDTTRYEFLFKNKNPERDLRDSLRFDIFIDSDSLSPTFISSDSIRVIGYGRQSDFLDRVNHDSILHMNKSKEQIMVKTVKMFVSQTDESFNSGKLERLFQLPFDSLLFMSSFRSYMDENNSKVTVSYSNDNEVSGNKFITLSVNSLSPIILVTKYSAYLLKRISTQILFALFLLCISSIALFLAWIGLKKQLALNSLRNDFIANISHELKTPVATVKIALEAIQNFYIKNDRKTTLEYLEMASKETERLEGLVDKVLQHSMLEDASLVLQKQSINLYDLNADLFQRMSALFDQFSAHVELVKPEIDTLVDVDPVYIEAVLRNLMDNAMKYAGPEPEVKISFSETDQTVILKLEDSGPGIPETYISQVFDKFFRVPTGDRHDVKGYGLGLNFAQQVLRSHGGSIKAENKSEGGCVFSLTFPKYKDEN